MPDSLLFGKRLFTHLIPSLIGVVFLLLAITSVQYDDVTFDEPTHLYYGIQVLKGKPGRSGNESFRSTMPVTALNALPRAAQQLIKKDLKKNDSGKTDVKTGRYVSIFAALFLLVFCFRFSALLTSSFAACIIMAFIAFDPNIIAHARLVTTDLYNTIAFIGVIYYLWLWLEKKNKKYFYYWCIAIAVAQCCKPNSILLYPVCMAIMLFYLPGEINKPTLIQVAKKISAFTLLQIVIINIAFLFTAPWGQSLSEMTFKSHFFVSLQNFSFSKIPLPFSTAFVDTFDLVQYERETFSGTLKNYLLGELRYKTGFWNYYLVCFFFKTPVLSILLITAGTFYGLIKKGIRKPLLLFCLWPCLFVFVFLSKSSIQNGYRYLLPVTCLALIFSSFLIEYIVKRFAEKRWLLLSILIPFITAIFAFPNYVAYTNILVWDKKKAYSYFADSNLNWGQRDATLQKFLKDNPNYIFEPEKEVKGLIIVDINNLAGLRQTEKFKWLRDNFTPVGTVDDCFLIYDTR